MSWIKIDDGFVEHTKMEHVGDKSFRMHMAALCYCARNLTDGELSARAVKVIAAVVSATRVNRNVNELVTAELWIDNGDGTYTLNGYLDYNPDAATVKADREKARERMRALRSGERSGERAGELQRNFAGSSVTPTRPVVKNLKPSGEESLEDRQFHALRLYGEVRDRYQTPQLRMLVMSYGHKLAAAQFQSVIDALNKHRHKVKDEGAWVSTALENQLKERAA